MEDVKNIKLCTLCQDIINDIGYQEISDTITEVIKTLNLRLYNDDNGKSKHICSVCLEKLNAAINFKSTCLRTEDVVLPYINSEGLLCCELEEVLLNKPENGEYSPVNQKVCRLCFRSGQGDFVSVHDFKDDVTRLYIPEVNWSLSKDPVICRTCWKSLELHSGFIRNCLELQENNTHIQTSITRSDLYIKTEEIEIKSENTGLLEDDIKLTNEEFSKQRKPKRKSRGTCKNFSGMQWHECDKCDHKTKRKHDLKIHMLQHQDLFEIKTFECDKCLYKGKTKYLLESHMAVHKDPSEINWYYCDICDYKGKRKEYLVRHKQTHKDRSNARWFKCDLCDSKFTHGHTLRRHMLLHKDPSEIQWYKCDVCDYKSKEKFALRHHKLGNSHKSKGDSSKETPYACDQCTYKGSDLRYLKRHRKIHEEPLWYYCEMCDYKARYKRSVKLHTIMHKDASEIQWFRCDVCDYKGKRKSFLRTHMLVKHRDRTQD